MTVVTANNGEPASAARSIVGRTAAAAALIALGAVAILFVVTYSVTSHGLTRALATTVDTDLAGLADIYATSGRPELVARLGDRQALAGREGHRAHYLLRERGRGIAGDATAWPTLTAATSGAGYVAIEGVGPVYARATRLGPELELTVAREYGSDRAILTRLMIAFAAAGLAIALAVFAMAGWRSRQLARRIDAINDAYRRDDEPAIAGLVGDRRADEIGELARHSGHALARQRRLLESQRHASDHIAHELRTPLLHLETRLRALLKPDAAPEIAETVAAAGNDIRRITTMLDSLLDIAASEASRGSSAGMVAFDLAALADDLAEVYRGSMEEAGLRFSTAIAPGVTMSGEPMQIGRMIANLLDNAIKYVPSGGAVRLEVDAGPTIVVADDGPGIAAEVAPRVFERFWRGSEAGHNPGHGLGLALARAIAQRHELSLTLAPAPSGARFRIAAGEGMA